MKPFSNLFTLVLCFMSTVLATNVRSQNYADQLTQNGLIGQAPAPTTLLSPTMRFDAGSRDDDHFQVIASQQHRDNWYATAASQATQYVDTLGEYFWWPGGIMRSIKCLPLDALCRQATRPGRITLTYGGPYGATAWAHDETFAGTGIFLTDEEIAGLQDYVETSNAWLNGSGYVNYDSSGYTFDEFNMEFMVEEYFPPGYMTMLLSIDPTDMNSYANGSTHAPWLTTYGNCASWMSCMPEAVHFDPYSNGYAISSGGVWDGVHNPLCELMGPSGGYDVAFELTSPEDLSTGVLPIASDLLEPIRFDGYQFVANELGQIIVYDATGKVKATDLQGQPVNTTGWTDGVYIAEFISAKQQRYTKRYLVTH